MDIDALLSEIEKANDANDADGAYEPMQKIMSVPYSSLTTEQKGRIEVITAKHKQRIDDTYISMLDAFQKDGSYYDEDLEKQFPLFKGTAPFNHPYPLAFAENYKKQYNSMGSFRRCMK